MNACESKELTRKPQKRGKKRKNKNLKNRNSFLQTNSDHVLQTLNIRYHPIRKNSGYLKHFQSISVRREKEHSTMDYFDEDTLRRMRNTRDMVKQHLMGHDQSAIITKETDREPNETSSISKSKHHRLSNEDPKISDSNKECSVTKIKRKPTKSSEEIAKIQLKQRRKNELREKFKQYNVPPQKSSENYNIKKIADLILKHISEMNKEKIMHILNSNDPRYGEALNYICKKKRLEVTKALRDLSCQENPEECEIINPIIPDFSIKIEELPIDVIKGLSITFDEMHKNVGVDSGLSDENLHLRSRTGALQTSNDLSFFPKQCKSVEVNGKNLDGSALNTKVQIDGISNHPNMIQNVQKSGDMVSIEILDSDEEILPSSENSTPLQSNDQMTNMEKVTDSVETYAVSSSNQSSNSEVMDSFPTDVSCKEEIDNAESSNQTVSTETQQFLNTPENISSQSGSKDSVVDTSSIISSSQNNGNDSDEIVKKNPDSTYLSLLDPFKEEADPHDLIPEEVEGSSSRPKVGSVWVSKNIFETSRVENQELDEFSESHIDNSLDEETVNSTSNNPTSAGEQNSESSTFFVDDIDEIKIEYNELNISDIGENLGPDSEEICPNVSGDIKLFQGQNNEINKYDDLRTSSPTTINDSSKHVAEINKKNFMLEGANKKDNTGVPDSISNLSNSNSQVLNDVEESVSSSGLASDNLTHEIIVPESIACSCEKKILNLSIKNRPKNLKEAITFMKAIDDHIIHLTKLKQDILIGLSENVDESEPAVSGKGSSKHSAESHENNAEISGNESQAFLQETKGQNEKSAESQENNVEMSVANGSQIERASIQESINKAGTSKGQKRTSNDPTNLQKNVEIASGNELRTEKALVQEINKEPEASKGQKNKSEESAESQQKIPVESESQAEASVQGSNDEAGTFKSEKRKDSVESHDKNTNYSVGNKPLVQQKSVEESDRSTATSKGETRKSNDCHEAPKNNVKFFGGCGLEMKEKSVQKSDRETESPKSKRPKLMESSYSPESTSSYFDGNESKIRKKTEPEIIPKLFDSLNYSNGVVLCCKILYDKNECVVGTDNGRIQYHSINGNKPLMTVNVSNTAIRYLESVKINDRCYICAGANTELKLKILRYKKYFIEHTVNLEDSIQALRNDWGYFFIGGSRGYLTRYDWKKNRIQYEDRISESCIKDLTTTREGPRRILVILFEDEAGESQIHVRDAMTALHIRTVIIMKGVRCMYVRFSSVYVVTDEQISVYNCSNSDYVRKVITQQPFFLMKSKGNLLVLASTNGIYAYNMKTNRYLGSFQEKISPASFFIYEQKVLCNTWSRKIEVIDVPDHCKESLEHK